MNKTDFVLALAERLPFMPWEEIEERAAFYFEIVDDLMEEGLSEEEAFAQIDSIDSIVEQIIADTPVTRLAKERLKPKKQMKAWEIVLLVLGSPIWLSLLIAVFAVLLSVYIVLWSVIISLWAVAVSVAVCALAGLIAFAALALFGSFWQGAAMFGSGLVCAGIAILLFWGCK